MSMPKDQVERIKAMRHDELVANAGSDDMGVIVEATMRLHESTQKLNWVLIALTVVLVALTAALVYFAVYAGH